MAPLKDLTGLRFGRLIVIAHSERKPNRTHMWLCVCDCGTVRKVAGRDLRSGHTQSCGCFRIDRTREACTKHGESKRRNHASTRLYNIWVGMNRRCNNPRVKEFKYYGARGIKVCDLWCRHYENFRDWALDNGYNDDLTIDRIDVNGDYRPDNCRWVTNAEQQRNKRNTRGVKGVVA